jgi:hypothetical protein
MFDACDDRRIASSVAEEKRPFLSALLDRKMALMSGQVLCVGLCDALGLHVHVVDMLGAASISAVRTHKKARS